MADKPLKIYQVIPEMYPRMSQFYRGQFYDGSGNLIPGITNPGQYRILVSDGTTTGSVGYDNFKFDGSTLVVGNSSNSDNYAIFVGQDTSGNNTFILTGSGSVTVRNLTTTGITGGYLYADISGNVYATGGGGGTGSGAQGPIGPTGPQGLAATIEVGTVSVTGSVPTITNVGTSFSAIFDFTFPLGSTSGGGNLQQTLTLGNTSSLNIDLFDSQFTSTKYSGEVSTISGGSIQINDLASNQVQIVPTNILVESTPSSITINDDSITKTDNSDGRYTEIIFDQTTPGGVNTITFQDGTGTVAFLTDVVPGPIGPTGADSTVPGPTGPTGPSLLIQREVGTFSGQDTVGIPLSYTVSFGVTFSGDYLVNVESSALRLFTVTNKNPNGFVIETNSNQLFDNVVYWQAWSFV
jgi:hypothetical protein